MSDKTKKKIPLSRITVWLTTEDVVNLSNQARAEGRTLSALVRKMLTGNALLPPGALLRELVPTLPVEEAPPPAPAEEDLFDPGVAPAAPAAVPDVTPTVPVALAESLVDPFAVEPEIEFPFWCPACQWDTPSPTVKHCPKCGPGHKIIPKVQVPE